MNPASEHQGKPPADRPRLSRLSELTSRLRWLRDWRLILGFAVVGLGLKFLWPVIFPTAARKPPPVLVTTTQVQQQSVPVIIEASGNIVAASIVDIRPQTTNLVSKVHIREGQRVSKGDLLFTLDDRADRANADKARALANDAQRQFERAKDLLTKGFISQAQLDTAKANAESASASARAAEAALSYDAIRSPIDGRAGVINVFPGSLVQASNTVSSASTASGTSTTSAMVTITQLNPIHVQFTVNEKSLPLLIGKGVNLKDLTVSVDLASKPEPVTGKVFVIDNQVDPAIGAVRVKASLDNADEAIIPGQFVRLRLKAKTLDQALVVPTPAVVTNVNGDFLFQVDDNNQVKLVPIKVVYQYQDTTVVTGLSTGSKIVVEGKQNLRPGDLIRENAAPAPKADAPKTDASK